MWRRFLPIVVLMAVVIIFVAGFRGIQGQNSDLWTLARGFLNDVLALVVAQGSGFVTGLISWWVLWHGITPSICFHPNISKVLNPSTDTNLSGFDYRIKIQNGGMRTIIDVEIFAWLRIIGLNPAKPDNVWDVIIPLDGESYKKIPRLLRKQKGEPRSQVLRLGINEVDEFRASKMYPDTIRTQSEQRKLFLEDLLSLGTEATLEIYITGYDGFSGAKKLFVSNPYTLQDIRPGHFPRGDIKKQINAEQS